MNITPSTTRVAFLGLGLMGRGMAERLIQGGYKVCVWNRDLMKATDFAERASIAVSPHQAAEGADFIISMLADDNASRSVWLDALKAVKPQAVCIESSTVSPAWVAELAAAAEARGAACIDAPVTGSRIQAQAGTLGFVAGGDCVVIERARPLFAEMGASLAIMGPSGSGAMFKLVNNFLCGAQLAALAEALAMVERSGLDRDTALATLMAGATGSPLAKTVSARMQQADYTPNFLVRLMAKDLNYATGVAAGLGLDLTMGRAAHAAFAAATAAGYGEQDIAAIYPAIASRAKAL